jgi:ribosomal-protein-alanine N-acetyltransferase
MSISERTLRFEALHEHHIDQLLAIEEEAYPDPWTPGMFRQEMINRTSHFFVAYAEEELVGYAGFWLLADEIHITKITVLSKYRRRGHGREILQHLCAAGLGMGAQSVRLEVRESNEAAQALYNALGFQNVGIRRDYYARSRESAVVMARALDASDQRD